MNAYSECHALQCLWIFRNLRDINFIFIHFHLFNFILLYFIFLLASPLCFHIHVLLIRSLLFCTKCRSSYPGDLHSRHHSSSRAIKVQITTKTPREHETLSKNPGVKKSGIISAGGPHTPGIQRADWILFTPTHDVTASPSSHWLDQNSGRTEIPRFLPSYSNVDIRVQNIKAVGYNYSVVRQPNYVLYSR